ncbi:unnamed protein product [Staurois parvus]|uniref:Uncharacterized protein n=1 Tax=Staurois parvus TaxID=386267 RepID=A0ABN9D732_9NEOB|nr:unnamed protein product [Staurois parvus]
MQTNLMQCVVYGLSTDRLTPPPLHPLQQCWQHSYVCFPKTTSGYEHVHSTSLVDHGEACSEWTCPVKAAVWSWPPCCSSVSGSW